MAQANAVETRIVLDLRIGFAFTRYQTLNLQKRYDALKEVISYGMYPFYVFSYYTSLACPVPTGPCQFPTLGFVVARYNKVKNFKPEPFWFIYLSLTRPSPSDEEPVETAFTWKRGHLFDLPAAWGLYEAALEHPTARVTKVTSKETKKWYTCLHLSLVYVLSTRHQEAILPHHCRLAESRFEVAQAIS